MPDVDSVVIAVRLGAFSEILDDDGALLSTEILVDDDSLDGVVVDFSDGDFTSISDDDIARIAADVSDEISSQVYLSMIAARDELHNAVISEDISLTQEPEWVI